MKKLFTILFPVRQADFTQTLTKAIMREMYTTQQARNIALLIETHIPDESKRKHLQALLTVMSAARGLSKVNITINYN